MDMMRRACADLGVGDVILFLALQRAPELTLCARRVAGAAPARRAHDAVGIKANSGRSRVFLRESQMMKLIGSLGSPYVRKARIVLAEKKIECQMIAAAPWDPGYPVHAYSPLGKLRNAVQTWLF